MKPARTKPWSIAIVVVTLVLMLLALTLARFMDGRRNYIAREWHGVNSGLKSRLKLTAQGEYEYTGEDGCTARGSFPASIGGHDGDQGFFRVEVQVSSGGRCPRIGPLDVNYWLSRSVLILNWEPGAKWFAGAGSQTFL